eukprot:TRINITY_DN4494_c0_g1_i1.p1 TRINITY_DN4494_c0_g1~~TRINITY_DN4494_c0_g1_i1.p1  ORF type:complete len:287 (-),score=111.07 TRINITY_DN4494_c0_g1_i1:83-943(-)
MVADQKLQGTPFVVKTYQLIEDAANSEIVNWNENGDAFVILKPVEFSSEILPKYFKHNNLCSFIRQLNTYGFNKQESKQWEFKHELFQKNHPEHLKNIARRKSKKRDQEKEDVDVDNSADRVIVKELSNLQVPIELEDKSGINTFGNGMIQADNDPTFNSYFQAFGLGQVDSSPEENYLSEQVRNLQLKQTQMQDAIIKILSELVDTKREQKSLERKVTLLSNEVIRLQYQQNPNTPLTLNPSLQETNPSTEYAGDESWAMLAKELGIDGNNVDLSSNVQFQQNLL